MDFLEAAENDDDEVELTGDVRLILVSANFSTELTTSVLWLNNHGLDITCIRLLPYRSREEILTDATQIIPLPETADYEVKMREQAKEKKRALSARHEVFNRFWGQFIERSREKTDLFAKRGGSNNHWLNAAIGKTGYTLAVSLAQNTSHVGCYISVKQGKDTNKKAFNELLKQKDTIETAFGHPLEWLELPEKNSSRINYALDGGWRSPEDKWPELQDRLIEHLIQLEKALRQPIQNLTY